MSEPEKQTGSDKAYKQCFGSVFIEPGSGSSQKFQSGSGYKLFLKITKDKILNFLKERKKCETLDRTLENC